MVPGKPREPEGPAKVLRLTGRERSCSVRKLLAQGVLIRPGPHGMARTGRGLPKMALILGPSNGTQSPKEAEGLSNGPRTLVSGKAEGGERATDKGPPERVSRAATASSSRLHVLHVRAQESFQTQSSGPGPSRTVVEWRGETCCPCALNPKVH